MPSMPLRVVWALATCAIAGCSSLSPRPESSAAMDPLLMGLSAEDRAQAKQQLVVTFRDERAVLAFEAGATPTLVASRAGYRGSAYARRIVAGLARDYELTRVTDWYIETLGVHCVVYRVADDGTRDALVERLRADRRVADVQPMQEFRTLGSANAPPADAAQVDPYARLQVAAARIGVPAAQQMATGRGVRIAIIDTGLDDLHADLAGRVESTMNFVDRDTAQFRRDRHGTAVGGTIAANSDNGAGIRGVAPQAHLVILKACWEINAAGSATCNSLTLAAAIEAAIRLRVHVINLSLAGPADRLLASLLERALARGISVVGAAPSEESSAENGFPASVRGVIAVVNADTPAVAAPVAALRLAAPGLEVLTLAPGGHYDYASGVSMSTALVSGVAALLLEHVSASAQRIAFVARLPELLQQTGDAREQHHPEINAARALRTTLRSELAQK